MTHLRATLELLFVTPVHSRHESSGCHSPIDSAIDSADLGSAVQDEAGSPYSDLFKLDLTPIRREVWGARNSDVLLPLGTAPERFPPAAATSALEIC